MLTTAKAYEIASQWGSYMTSGDPGAVFYSFPIDDARPQSEEHRAQCLAYTLDCIHNADESDSKALQELEAFFIYSPLTSEKPGPRLIVEIMGDDASMCLANGEEVISDADIAEHVADCNAGGDVSGACEYLRDVIGVDFRIVAIDASGKYENRPATSEEKAECCRAIYFDSDTDFSDEATAETYLIWQAARDIEAEACDA